MLTTVSIVIPTRNEALQISECVRGLAWPGEVIGVDGASSDGTAQAARGAGGRVLNGAGGTGGQTIAPQRNAGIAAASHEWVFVLDADERIGPDLADVGRLAASLEHFPYRGVSHSMHKLDRYATWGAEDLAARGRRPRLSDLLFRPPARFARMYLLQLGVLEGWRGAVLCGLAAVSVFLKYARLWERSP